MRTAANVWSETELTGALYALGVTDREAMGYVVFMACENIVRNEPVLSESMLELGRELSRPLFVESGSAPGSRASGR